MKLVPLSRADHGALRMRPLPSFLFARASAVVSLFGTEAPRAAHEFPIMFTAEPEGYFPAALLGLSSGQNLFVDAQGRWRADYIPAVWRRGAFRLAKLQDKDDWVLCVDESSDLLSATDGQPLFDADGNPAEIVAQASRFLTQLERDRLATLAACTLLDRHGLITPADLKIAGTDGAVRRLEGLFRIDESKIVGLSGDSLAELRNLGALPLLYAHLLSQHKLKLLGRLAAEHEDAQRQRQAVQGAKLNLDQVFGIVEDDPFIF